MESTFRPPHTTAETLDKTIAVAPAQPTDATVRTVRPTDGNTRGASNASSFMLKGKEYQQLECLSDNSGEAQVFLVGCEGKEYVLKVYYPNFSIDKKLLRLIHNIDFEMIVRLYDFGKTYVEGKNRDYELMEYLRGRTLNEYSLRGDFNQFRHIALQAAAALAYCHNNNIIHKDIKPGNFFFRDEEHTQLVLGDFGISSIVDENEQVHRTTQARTPTYAAPEMYNDVIDGEVEITKAVDFYSLGLTLMTLWLGENPLNSNERIIMRKKNEGRLPRMNDLPDRVKMIVQGLTAVNPASRWGYEEVEHWFLGEDVKVDISSPMLRYKSFVVDPERNLVADNVHELIPLLVENDRAAMGYLYGGRISAWLESCGNVKLSTTVKDIVTNRYPVDQAAGLMAAVYAMEPTYPYKDAHGNLCDDVHSAVISMLAYIDEYALLLKSPNDRLWLYLESHTKANMERLRGYFAPDSLTDGRISVLKVAFEVDTEIPFLHQHKSGSLEDIAKAFGTGDMTEDEWQSLTDGRLLSWMYSHEDHMACEALRIMTEGQPYSRQLAYKVLYNVERESAYDLQEARTSEEVGELLRQQLMEWQSCSAEEFAENIKDFSDPDGRFCFYAQLHGWHEALNEARRCFDLKSDENRERLSAYDLRTAAYRFCRILGVVPTYRMPNGKEWADAMNTEGIDRSEIRMELRRGSLAQWMSIWYHEDPTQDFASEYSYERKLEEWTCRLGETDPQQPYFKRYEKAKKETADRFAEVRQGYRRAVAKEKAWQVVFYGLCAVWVVLLIVFGIDNRAYILEHPVVSIGLPVGGVSAFIMALRAFFKGYGFMISCMWGALGALSSAIPIWTLRYVEHSHPVLFIPAVILLTLVYMLVCYLTDFSGDSKQDHKLISEVLDDDINTTLLEPLYYTFKQKSVRYKGSKFGMLDDVQNQIHSVAGERVLHYVLWSIMIGLLVGEMLMFHPKMLDMKTPTYSTVNTNKVVKTIQQEIK